MAEKLITLARTGTLTARRRVIATLHDRRLVDEEQEFTGKTVIQKLFDEAAPRFVDRPGGTRHRQAEQYRIGDAGSLVLLQLVGEEPKTKSTSRRAPAAPQAKRAPPSIRRPNHEKGQGCIRLARI